MLYMLYGCDAREYCIDDNNHDAKWRCNQLHVGCVD